MMPNNGELYGLIIEFWEVAMPFLRSKMNGELAPMIETFLIHVSIIASLSFVKLRSKGTAISFKMAAVLVGIRWTKSHLCYDFSHARKQVLVLKPWIYLLHPSVKFKVDHENETIPSTSTHICTEERYPYREETLFAWLSVEFVTRKTVTQKDQH